jgi:DNA-binding GntR family transcriptional regulator
MSGEFAPGERLTVRQVAALTQTSVMPVREAFRRLTSEGALEPMSSGATRVPKIDADEFEEITNLRLSVEGLAARLAATRISAEELDELEAANARILAAAKRRDGHAEARANEAFHFIIYRAARSRILLQIIEGLWLRIGPVLITLFDDLNATQPGRLAGTKYHARLIAALRGGDTAGAESALQDDLGHAAKYHVRRLKQMGATAGRR